MFNAYAALHTHPQTRLQVPPERHVVERRLRRVRWRPAHRPHLIDACRAERGAVVLVNYGARAAIPA